MKEGNKKVIIEKTVDTIVESVIFEYEEGAKKASIDMDVETLTLNEDFKKSNSENSIDAVSTEDAKKAISENVEALHTEDDPKYAIS